MMENENKPENEKEASQNPIYRKSLAKRASTPSIIVFAAIVIIGRYILKLDFNFFDSTNILIVGIPIYIVVILFLWWQQERQQKTDN